MDQTSIIVNICTWFSRLVWLNLCWIMFSLLGGLVFGVFPATTTVLIMMRRYLNGGNRISLKDFYSLWRAELITTNQSLLPLFLVAASIVWYLNWSMNNDYYYIQLMSLALLPLLVFNCLMTCAVLIQASVYRGPVKQQWLQGITLLSGVFSLPLIMLISVIICLIGSLIMPIFALLFLISPGCLLTMSWYLHHFPEHKILS